jgi:glycosyltransferase involved in cell wall biosynthesis
MLGRDRPRAPVQVDQAETRLLHAAIVTILYRKAEHVASFLDAVFRQSYAGPMTVVFVDDGSPDTAFSEMERRIRQSAQMRPANIAVKTVRNAENRGNCLSRNAGIAAVDADIYVVIDADCLINRDFVSAHVAEHQLPGTDAVVGPYNIETNGQDGFRLLRQLENDPEHVTAHANMQDELLPRALVNTVTRNLSISRRWLDQHGGFDPVLSYSARPDSGYGWEDVEIGARIYAAHGQIRYTRAAFSIHMSHASSLPESAQVRGSAKNFRHLVEKHDFIRSVCRRWYVDTADRIVEWAQSAATASPEIEMLRADIKPARAAIAPLLPYLRKKRPRYRILTHRWHVPHQCEIYKLPFDFTLVTGTGSGVTNSWSFDQRPLPDNAQMVSIADVDPSQFDMAIVHFDENVLCPDLSNGVLGADWGDTFRWFTENVRIPMVGICHGTMPFVGQYAANPDPIAGFETYEADADALRERLAGINVVVNSHQAAAEWKFRKSRVIWHGYDPQEFLPGPHDLDVVTHGVDRSRPHYRGAHALETVLARLGPDIGVSTHKHVSQTPVPRGDPRYSGFAFQNWLDHLGRHKIYLNTTLRSPMPRSRTEAMLCGVIPVSLDNHDVSRFIENGVNGFNASSPEELADFCRSVCRDPAMQSAMSAAARATAMDVFNHDRFLTQWVTLVEETIA